MGSQASQVEAPLVPSIIEEWKSPDLSDEEGSIYDREYIPSSYYDVYSSAISEVKQSCAICYNPIHSSQIVTLPCHSPFCTTCISLYLEVKINNLEVLSITCPVPQCQFEFTSDLIKDNISTNLFQKYCKLLYSETLSKNPNLRWCPAPDCSGYDIFANNFQMTCNVCSTFYCFHCSEIWKDKHTCKMSDKPLEYWFKKGIRYCPNCKRKVEKNYGCDHMTCIKCKYQWCWLCGEKFHVNHYLTCEIEKLRKLNPPWVIIFSFIFAPILLAFSVAIGGLHYWSTVNEYNSCVIRFLAKCCFFTYPITFVLCIAVTPVFFLFLPLIIGVISVREMFRKYNYNCAYCLATFVVGVAFYPLVAVAICMGVVSLQFVGVALVFKKFQIWLKRCCDAEYLLPKSEYARRAAL